MQSYPDVFRSSKTSTCWAHFFFSQQICTADVCRCVKLRTLKSSSACLTGAWVCCRPWRRAMSWTWSTSQRESSPSPSPAAWRRRAMLPTCRRLPPCCAPNTVTTTWYAFLHGLFYQGWNEELELPGSADHKLIPNNTWTNSVQPVLLCNWTLSIQSLQNSSIASKSSTLIHFFPFRSDWL